MTTTTAGEMIACIRTALGLTRADLAAAIDVSHESIRSWEVGRRPVPAGIWDELAKLEAQADQEVAGHLAALERGAPAVFQFDTGPQAGPVGWQQVIAARVHRQRPDLTISRGNW
ncbi:helix-turn-helix transcriptional regulator [Kocuria sp. cx-455]|uniref:helix-turn-helix domain-containing protein n=1 Tax=Kocuria sp. cx-455 TaxID=2771377 RepID=UPI001688C5BD|nr:helix-turn-helix transcriptional regulator [Kocuria sp. cx-455]MBD2766269.1 helix-turn-helix transcriptional regulator [Kocuria sp. cx-455]